MAGNFQGRKPSRISKKWPFCRENFHGMLKPVIGGCGTPKFHGENFHGWLKNCEICECFLPRPLYVTLTPTALLNSP